MIKKKLRSFLHKIGITNNSLFYRTNIYSKKTSKRVLLLHKIDPFIYNLSGDFSHVNNFEIKKISEVFNELGYVVDILDRDHKSFIPAKKYDIFFGIAAGDSGSEFSRISKLILDKNKNSLIIPLCLGPEPELSNLKTINRYKNFTKRNNLPDIDFSNMMRVIKKVKFKDSVGVPTKRDFPIDLRYDVNISRFRCNSIDPLDGIFDKMYRKVTSPKQKRMGFPSHGDLEKQFEQTDECPF